MKTVIIREDKLMLIKESSDEVTFYQFFTELKNFIKDLLDDPIGAKPSSFFTSHSLNRSTLINKMIDRNIIVRKENIDEPNDADGNMKSMHYVQFKVPRKNFEQKIKRLYSYFFENGKKKTVNENKEDKTYNSVAVYIFCVNEKGQKCVLAGKRRGYGFSGCYNVPTGLVGDVNPYETIEDAAVREVGEESGLKISINDLEDGGETPYTTKYGEQLGKNFVVYLDGTTGDYELGEGDGENEPFIWMPQEAIDMVPWAFDEDKEVKKYIR